MPAFELVYHEYAKQREKYTLSHDLEHYHEGIDLADAGAAIAASVTIYKRDMKSTLPMPYEILYPFGLSHYKKMRNKGTKIRRLAIAAALIIAAIEVEEAIEAEMKKLEQEWKDKQKGE